LVTPLLDRPEIAEMLENPRLLHIAVETGRGPHVTPTAYAVAGGRIWLVSSRNTVKVRAMRRDPRVSVLVRDGERSLAVSGTAEVLSPWGPGDALRLARNAWWPRALAGYGLRNAALLGGYLIDTAGCAAGSLPYDRVLIGITPSRAMLIEVDAVLRAFGRWPSPRRASSPQRRAGSLQHVVSLEGVPQRAAATVSASGHAALGWSTPSGPVVLAARVLDGNASVLVSAQALRVAGAADGEAACLTFDGGLALRPTRLAGAMLRGRGFILSRRGALAQVALDVERVSWWSGFRTGTVLTEARTTRATRVAA
jgi:hypothetical protein